MKILLCFTLFICLSACGQDSNSTDINYVQEKENIPDDSLNTYEVAYFASGCFWCLEAIYETVDGVVEAESGYCGGTVKDPTYRSVCSGSTGHAETVKVYYDSSVVSYSELVTIFFNSHDPTTKNQQGPDSGTQYRSAIFYQNENEEQIADSIISELISSERFSVITTEVSSFSKFYLAEEYHQDYVRKNQEASYVKNVSFPRIRSFFDKMPKYNKK